MGRVGEAKWLMGLDGVMRGSRILAAGAVRLELPLLASLGICWLLYTADEGAQTRSGSWVMSSYITCVSSITVWGQGTDRGRCTRLLTPRRETLRCMV